MPAECVDATIHVVHSGRCSPKLELLKPDFQICANLPQYYAPLSSGLMTSQQPYKVLWSTD